MKYLFFATILLISISAYGQSETTIYNSKGEAQYYIDNSSSIIYSFNGDPVAYLTPTTDAYNIYTYSGKHLGWYENGILRDHDGKIAGFKKDAVTNVYYNYEPYKGYKKYEPYKSYEEIEPYKPYYTNLTTTNDLNAFFSIHLSEKTSTPSPYGNQTYVPQVTTFKPDLDFYGNALSKLQSEHDRLISSGYIYDLPSNAYIYKTEYEKITKERINNISSAIKYGAETKYGKNGDKVQDGIHTAYFFCLTQKYPILYIEKIMVKKGKIKYLLISNKKWPAFEGIKIDHGICRSRFKTGTKFENIFRTISIYPPNLFIIID